MPTSRMTSTKRAGPALIRDVSTWATDSEYSAMMSGPLPRWAARRPMPGLFQHLSASSKPTLIRRTAATVSVHAPRRSRWVPSALRITGRFVIVSVQMLCLWHLIAEHVAEINITTGSSMTPTLAPSGEWVLHVRLPLYNAYSRMRSRVRETFGLKAPPTEQEQLIEQINRKKHGNPSGLAIGDLVVAASPVNPARIVCKRVLGLAGDTILLDPRYEDSPQVTIPKGHVFLCGDNLPNSTDSRSYGPIPLGLIKGRVVARVFPAPSWLGNNMQHHPA